MNLTSSSAQDHASLIVKLGTRVCAVPLAHVVETMRPLPIEAMDGAADFIAGVAVIRGLPTPVVDLAALFEKGERSRNFGRFVTLRADRRIVALAVQSVVGIRSLEPGHLHALPSFLRDCRTDYVEAMGTLEEQLLLVLRATRLLPEDLWENAALAEGAP